MPVQTRHTSVIAENQAPLRQQYKNEPLRALTRKAAKTSSANVPAADPFHGEVEVIGELDVRGRVLIDRDVRSGDESTPATPLAPG